MQYTRCTLSDPLTVDAGAHGETTTGVAHEYFAEEGRVVSKNFISTFLERNGFALYKPKPWEASEVDDEANMKKEAYALWDTLAKLYS